MVVSSDLKSNTTPQSPMGDIRQNGNQLLGMPENGKADKSPKVDWSKAGQDQKSDAATAGQPEALSPPVGDETLISSVDIRAGRVLVGAGMRGGVLNWAGLGVDVISGSNVVMKMITNKPILETDKLVLGGYLEGSFRETDDKLTQIVSTLLKSKGLNFEAGLNLDVQFTGDGEGGLRLEHIKVATIIISPQVGNSPKGYRNFGGVGSAHAWTFGKDGSVNYTDTVQMRQGTFGVVNPPSGDGVVNLDMIPGTRGLAYAMLTRDVNEANDWFMGIRQAGAQFDMETIKKLTGQDGVNVPRVMDAVIAADFLGRIGNALVGEPNLDPDGKPETTTLRGWVRLVQGLTPAQIATPPNVPMPGLFLEANGYIKVVEDGDPKVRFFTTASKDPFMEISVEQLKTFYERTTDAVDQAVDRVLSFDFFRAQKSNPTPQATDTSADLGEPTEIAGAKVLRYEYSPRAVDQVLAAAQNFNANSNTNLALGYVVRDPESGKTYVELAAGRKEGEMYTGITPSQARSLLSSLRQDDKLPEDLSDDRIYRSNGIGTRSPEIAGKTPNADLIERDATIYFSSLQGEQVVSAAQKARSGDPITPTVTGGEQYTQALEQTVKANSAGEGNVSIAVPAKVNMPYDSPEDTDTDPDFIVPYAVTLVYSDLSPRQAVEAINLLAERGLLQKPASDILRDNGLQMQDLEKRQELLDRR